MKFYNLNILDHYEGVLAFIGALLGLFAIIFATIQYKDAKRHTKALMKLVSDLTNIKSDFTNNLTSLFQELNEVKNELSTTYIDKFPNFTNEINKVIESAENELLIVCDFPAYSYFSDYKGWSEYHNLINTKTDNGVTVSMIYLAKDQTIERIKEQFLSSDPNNPTDSAWEQKFQNPEFQKKMKKFVEKHDTKIHKQGLNTLTSKEVTFEHFLKLTLEATKNILKVEFLDVNKFETKNQLSLFCWIADGKKAVFAIPRSEVDNAELGFKTSDKLLIGALKSIFKTYIKHSVAIKSN